MTSLETVLSNFSAAEQALRELVEGSKSLAAAETRVDVAFTSLKGADATLTDSRATLDRSADRVVSLATVLEDTAEQFRVAAAALNQLNPAEIAEVGQETQAELHKLGTRLEQVIREADSAPMIEAAKVLILQTQAEQAERVRAKVDEAVTLVQNRTTALETALLGIARRQTIAVAFSIVAALLAAVAVVATFLR